jgi:hypothetical protein
LEWIIPPKAACLNAGHPRLIVQADPENYEEFAGLIWFVSVLFDGAGFILVLRGLGSMLLRILGMGRAVRMFPDLVLKNVLPL